MSLSDSIHQLTEGLRRGDPSAQEQLLSRYAPRLFQLIARLTPNTADAEELTQDTLLRAIHNIERFEPSKASFATWLSRIAYRLTLNHLRQPSLTTVTLDENTYVATDEEISQALQTPDDTTADLLHKALDYLPPDDLTLINLFYYDELPLNEIAYIVDRPPGNIATQLHRIRKKLFSIILKLKQQ